MSDWNVDIKQVSNGWVNLRLWREASGHKQTIRTGDGRFLKINKERNSFHLAHNGLRFARNTDFDRLLEIDDGTGAVAAYSAALNALVADL